MLIAVGTGKSSPGCTTLGLGLAALWPRPDATLVECDPAGGDLWARFGHHPEPGLSGLAAAATWEGPIPGFFRQRLSVGADVVLAIPGDGAAASVLTLADRGLDALRQASTTATVILDVGRLDTRSPAVPLAAAADHVLLLSEPALAQQSQVGARLAWLSHAMTGKLWLVGVGEGGHGTADLGRDLGLPAIGTVPHSKWGAGVLSGQLSIPNWRRLKLARAVRRIAAALCALDSEPEPEETVVWRAAGRRAVPPLIEAQTGAGRQGVPR